MMFHLGILRLMTRGAARCRRAGLSRWSSRCSAVRQTWLLASVSLGGESAPGGD